MTMWQGPRWEMTLHDLVGPAAPLGPSERAWVRAGHSQTNRMEEAVCGGGEDRASRQGCGGQRGQMPCPQPPGPSPAYP